MFLEIKNDINEISRVCNVIKDFCDTNRIPSDKYHDIVLILDEMLTNVISYAYKDGKEHTFTLDIAKNGDCVCVEVVDGGVPFNPLLQKDPDIESELCDRKIGGLGIFLSKQLADDMKYQRLDDKNHLQIKISVQNKEEHNGNKNEK